MAGGEDGAVAADWRPEGVVWAIRLSEGVKALDSTPAAPGPRPRLRIVPPLFCMAAPSW
ncbi:hypothetical protein ACFSYD_22705 [Paracoccus aerius]